MSIQLPNLTSLTAENVRVKLATLSSLIDSLDIGVDTSRGVFRDLVLRNHAILQEAYDSVLKASLESSVPSLAAASTGTLDTTIVNAMASSYGLAQIAASAATGGAVLVFSSSKTVFIPAGSRFASSDGRVFVTSTAYALKTSASNVTFTNERQLIQRADGRYQSTIELTSEDKDAAANIKIGEAFTPLSVTLPNLVSVTASTDFYGGRNSESLKELMLRLQQSIPAKSLSTRASAYSFLTQADLFPDLKAVSVIGAGDLEMQRDQRTMFPGGNKVDIYVRSAIATKTKTVSIPASVVQYIDGGVATWLCHVDRDQLPGFYRVVSVAFEDTAVTQPKILATVLDKDMSPIYAEQVPAAYYDMEASFSRYQTGNITFTTPATPYALGSSSNVIVTLEGMPDIEKIQSVVSSRGYRFATGDTLVRAAFPCYVSVAVKVNIRVGTKIDNAATIRAGVADSINSQGFVGELYASAIAATVQSKLPYGANVARIDLVGEYIKADGSIIRKRVNDVLSAIHDYPQSMSNRTTIFITNAAAIQMSLHEQQFSTVV